MLTTICCHNIWWQLTTLVPFRWMVGLAAARERTEQYKGVGLCTQHCLKKKKRMKKRKKRFRGQVLFINTCMLAKEHSTPHIARQAAQSASLLRDLDSRWQAPSVKVLLAMATAMKQFRQIVFMLLRAQNNQLESFLYHAHLHQAYKPTSSTVDYW